MNQIVTRPDTSINSIGVSNGVGGASIAPQNLGEVVRFAEVMCKADIALPKHLRGNAGACMAVAMQALEWQMSPFAVASKSYAVNGAIAYEAQLIAAVVNTRSGIKGRLKYFFDGEGSNLTCRVVGILDGEECEYTSPTIGSITTKNSPLWKSDPQQQLGYFSARSWARRHCPEVILGVYDREEVEQFRGSENARDVTPSLSDRLKLAKIEQHDANQAREGFDASHVARETAALTGEADSEQETTDQEPSEAAPHSATDEGSGVEYPRDPAADDSVAQESGEAEAGDIEAREEPDASSASGLITRNLMVECLDKFMGLATAADLDVKQRRDNLEFAKEPWKEALPTKHDFVKACLTTADKVAKGELGKDAARKYLEGLV